MTPEKKDAARRLVARAIYHGFLVRSEICEQCGIEAKVQGHHTDYARPLDVMWLCAACHGEQHRGVFYRSAMIALTGSLDVKAKGLRKIAEQMEAARALEPERDSLIRELAAEMGPRKLSKLAEIAGLTRGRVHQIVKRARANADG